MSSPRTVGEVVTRVYTAAGRRATDAEFELYAEALGDVDDAVAVEASRRMVGREDWRNRPPSPALLIEYVRLVAAEARGRRPAIPSATGPRARPDVARRELARARAMLARAASPPVDRNEPLEEGCAGVA